MIGHGNLELLNDYDWFTSVRQILVPFCLTGKSNPVRGSEISLHKEQKCIETWGFRGRVEYSTGSKNLLCCLHIILKLIVHNAKMIATLIVVDKVSLEEQYSCIPTTKQLAD